MKKTFILVLVFISTFSSFAQKKLVPVTESTLTGIQLPGGSLQDKRMLSVSAANMLMEIESKKSGRAVSTTEVLVLPPADNSRFDNSMLVKELSEKGWQISVNKDDNKYAWLQRGNQSLFMYFSMNTKESNLFFSKTSANAIQYFQENKNSNIQNVQIEQTQLPKRTAIPVETNQVTSVPQPVQPVTNIGFAFTTTNFDDGWVANEETDWVSVTKGNLKVLLHYAKEGTTIAADPEPHINNAWNILVAPRYSNLRNYKVASPSLDQQRAYLGAGDLTDNKTGKQVYVALFRKGNSGWVEFIAPDKNTFVREYGADINNIGWDTSSDIWKPLLKMMNCNKFAVAASDLPGNWKSSSGAGIQYYSIYTGNNMGMASASSTTEFIFQQDGTYTSIYKGVDGFNGNNRYAGETCNGNAMVSNWEMKLTNRFKGATETFAIQFEAVKGGRILHMYRGNIEELHLFRIN